MKIRVKMRQMPGDICKQMKIAMLERKSPERARAKGYRNEIRKRERAAFREQSAREIKGQLRDEAESW